MDAETAEIRDFLNRYHPFDLLPEEVLAQLARSLEITYVRRGTVLTDPGKTMEVLYVIRTGAVETRDPSGTLLARLGEGEYCGARALLRGGLVVNRSEAIEDCLLYVLPGELFDELRRNEKPFAYFFRAFQGGSLRESFETLPTDKPEELLTLRVKDLSHRAITIEPGATILSAAQRMRDEKVSSLLVTEGGALVGILTDGDLRNRVVAAGISYDLPVRAAMSTEPTTISSSSYAFDALLTMTRQNVHHLPVTHKGLPVGCLTAADLIHTQVTTPLFLVRDINMRNTTEGLKQVVAQVPRLVRKLVDAGASTQRIGHMVSAITDAVTVRLLQLAEQTLGPPPLPYVWVAAGSQARNEQTALSDQDNCIVIDDRFEETRHDEYFRALSNFVCNGLDSCGYRLCPGEMMATTARWRQPLSVWKAYFTRWIEDPEPQALLLCSIFFDLRPVHGQTALFTELHDMILEKSSKSSIFLSHMTRNALHNEPPIGFFRDFVLIRGGEHDRTLNLKVNGVMPITDLARIYALAIGSGITNTFDRLTAAQAADVLSQEGGQNLRDALEFINMARLRHQARLIAADVPPNNFLPPSELSRFERNHLRNAFKVVKDIQAAMGNTYQVGRF